MSKKEYSIPVVDVVCFSEEDVIRTSGDKADNTGQYPTVPGESD